MPEQVHFEFLLKRLGKLVQFELFKTKFAAHCILKGIKMDPITAVFNFLSTPAGQLIVTDLRNLNQDFLKLVMGFMQKIHDKPSEESKK